MIVRRFKLGLPTSIFFLNMMQLAWVPDATEVFRKQPAEAPFCGRAELATADLPACFGSSLQE